MKSLVAPLLSLAAAGTVLLSGASARGQGQVSAKPNVLFIVADDLRPELGCYGRSRAISPNIDKLAGSGFLFQRAYCPEALCAPSRASVLTGCWPDTTGVHGLSVPLAKSRPDLPTLPQVFKNAGYETISLGKIYHHRGGNDDPTMAGASKPWVPNGERGLGMGYTTPEKARALFQLRTGSEPATG